MSRLHLCDVEPGEIFLYRGLGDKPTTIPPHIKLFDGCVCNLASGSIYMPVAGGMEEVESVIDSITEHGPVWR
jgi:hypothetical protein